MNKTICLLMLVLMGCSTSFEGIKRLWRPKKEKQKIEHKLDYRSGPSVEHSENFPEIAGDLGLKDAVATNLYAVDFDNDGFTDLVLLPDYYSVPVFYRYDGKQFLPLSYSPFESTVSASLLYFVDFNRDGILDLLAGTLNQKTELTKTPLRLFQGKIKKGKVFYQEQVGAFPSQIFPLASLAVFDFDLDGQLDVYLGNWFNYVEQQVEAVPDRLFKGDGFKFKDVSSLLEEEHDYKESLGGYYNARPSFGVSTCDVDQNGFPDILVAASSGYENKLWMNLYQKKKGRFFKDYGKESGFAADQEGTLNPQNGGNSFFATCCDYNNDSIMDIILGELSHAYDQETRDRSSILTGSRQTFPPQFIRTEYYMDDGTGRWSQGDRRGFFMDYNLDGLVDIVVANSGFPPKSRLVLFEQEDNHAFKDVGQQMGIDIANPMGTILIDIDRDGRPDLISGQTRLRDASINSRIYFFKNEVKRHEKRSLRIYLCGRKSNRDALGAMLMLNTSKRQMRHWVEYASGAFISQNEKGIFFGLGTDALENLTVRWPYFDQKKNSVLEKKYDLSSLKFKEFLELTLYETGTFKIGRNRCN